AVAGAGRVITGQYLWLRLLFLPATLSPPAPISLLDLAAEHAPYQAELDAAWRATVQEAAFIQGPAVQAFANELGGGAAGAATGAGRCAARYVYARPCRGASGTYATHWGCTGGASVWPMC
nr:hypothetical protein [Tanacetum cinerariifolium]